MAVQKVGRKAECPAEGVLIAECEWRYLWQAEEHCIQVARQIGKLLDNVMEIAVELPSASGVQVKRAWIYKDVPFSHMGMIHSQQIELYHHGWIS